jgi:hypothetical protein
MSDATSGILLSRQSPAYRRTHAGDRLLPPVLNRHPSQRRHTLRYRPYGCSIEFDEYQ